MTSGRIDDIGLFSAYMKLANVPHLEPDEGNDSGLSGKRVGLVNGSAWIQLWSYYFGRKHLPGVKLVNIGNEGVQLNFMQAHREGLPCPPDSNVRLFADYTRQLIELAGVQAILVTCSTMNRSFDAVREAAGAYGVPAVQIDEPMMEKAVQDGGKILVVATHGPTVDSTTRLLRETAEKNGGSRQLAFAGATVEEAFEALGAGDIRRHNDIIADAIRDASAKESVDRVVLAQLSMSVFSMSYPDPVREFGMPVLCSGDEGFRRTAEILRAL